MRLKLIHCSGEVLDEKTREFLELAFKCRVFESYWANEVGCIAWECDRREGKHINSDLMLLEVVDGNEPVGAGERGEIVVTGFMNYAMPLIRYRIGDIGVLETEKCSCGRGLPLLRSVKGRVVDCLTMPDGRRLTPKEIMTTLYGIRGASRFQVVQEDLNTIRLEFMRRAWDQEISITDVIKMGRDSLGDDVKIDVVMTGRENLRAKFRPVISKLTLDGERRWTKPRFEKNPP
ncbi:MAG: phenylacetate--CoA ligase family protein [Thermoproteota archaeon]